MEQKIIFTNVFGKNVLGNKKFKTDIMLALDYEGDFSNFYMSTKVAEELYEQLGKKLQENKENK